VAPRAPGLPPGLPQRAPAPFLFLACEGVEHVELVRRTSEPALLELARHRDQPLGGGGHVFARGATAPGVSTRATVREHAPRKHEAVLALGPEVGERSGLFVLEEPRRRVELGLDIRLVAVRAHEGRIAAGAEE